MGRYVAGDAGVAVLAPGSTHLVGFFVDDDVVESGLPQADRRQHAGGAGTDDGDALGGVTGGGLSVVLHGASLFRKGAAEASPLRANCPCAGFSVWSRV